MELLVPQVPNSSLWSSSMLIGVLVAAVDDAGHLARAAQAAARTRALRSRGTRVNSIFIATPQLDASATRRSVSRPNRRPRPCRPASAIETRYSMNSELTESSSQMRRIVSASSPPPTAGGSLACRAPPPQRNRVGHDQLVERRLRDALHRGAGQHRVRAIRDHFHRALVLQRLRRLAQRAGGVDHVVDDHAGAALRPRR